MHAAFPDFADVLADALTAAGWPAGTVLPADLGPRPGQTNRFVLVEVIGGPSGVLEARPAVDLSVLAPTYAALVGMTRAIDAWLTTPGGRRLVHTRTGVVTVIDTIETQVFREVPWSDSGMRQMMTTITPTVRRGTGVTSGPPQADTEHEGFFLGSGTFVPDPAHTGFFIGG